MVDGRQQLCLVSVGRASVFGIRTDFAGLAASGSKNLDGVFGNSWLDNDPAYSERPVLFCIYIYRCYITDDGKRSSEQEDREKQKKLLDQKRTG